MRGGDPMNELARHVDKARAAVGFGCLALLAILVVLIGKAL